MPFRLVKEAAYYEKEVAENEQKLEQMKAEKKDPYDIKKFEEVLGESYMMVPDSKSRLSQALKDLEVYLESSEVANLQPNEWITQAKEVLDTEKGRMNSAEDEVKETSLEGLGDGEAF